MKILKSEQYINEKLNIQPVSKERLADFSKKPIVDKTIAKFIKENKLKWNPSTRSYDCVGDIAVNKDIVSKGKITIKFGHVMGSFNCRGIHLTTLEGAPMTVIGNFDCSENKLESLKGAPQKVGGDFYCKYNTKLVLPNKKPSWLNGEIVSRT